MKDKLREVVKKLFQENKVNLVIGYNKGTLPLRSTPVIITNEKECDKLIFDFTCSNNLANYLQKSKLQLVLSENQPVPTRNGSGKPSTEHRVGIIAKGCDARSIVQYIVEGQIKREDIVIIGVPCEGVVDFKKVKDKIGEKEILEHKIVGAGLVPAQIVLEGRDFKVSLSKQEMLDDTCLCCEYPNPPVYDIFIGEPVLVAENRKPITDNLEKMSPDERWAYFEHEISKCIRCYACRNACPVCYCEECFVDQTTPQWFGKSTHISDTMLFHIVRMLHVAGRCVGCGACARACPVGINLAPLGIRIEKEIKERFSYTAGLSTDAIPPLAAYNEEDKQEFIM